MEPTRPFILFILKVFDVKQSNKLQTSKIDSIFLWPILVAPFLVLLA